jgi:Abnormal spindle-like microcephaly-assoc'd, ASPM-SPD-2-Hydin
VRQVEFRASLSQSELKRLRQSKPSAGLVIGVVAVALAWIFSAFSLGPSQLDFGTLQLGSGGRRPVQMTNRGLTEFRAASIALEGEDAADFEVDRQACTTVNAGQSCVLWVDFRPRESGTRHARLVVRTNDGNEFRSELTGHAEGRMPPKPPEPAPEPNPLGVLPPNQNPTPAHPLIASSSGPAPAAPPAHSPDAAPHSTQGVSAAPIAPDPPQSSPTPPVRPPQVGIPPHIPPSQPAPPPALRPHLTMTPRTAQFSSSSPDGEFYTAATQTVVVRSDGTADVQPLNLRVGPAGVPFNYSTNCPTRLASGRSCAVQVQFSPRDARPYVAALTAYEGSQPLASVPLRGASKTPPAGHPHLTMTPGTLKFASSPQLYDAVHVAARQTVEIRSDGTADLRDLNLRVNPSSAPFRYSNCSPRLPRGQTCTVQVNFVPKNAGQYAGTLDAYEAGLRLGSVELYGSGGSPRKQPGPSVSGVVDRAYPGGTNVPGKAATSAVPSLNRAPGKSNPPPSANPSSNATHRALASDKAAASGQIPRVLPGSAAAKDVRAQRPAQKPKQQPPPVR